MGSNSDAVATNAYAYGSIVANGINSSAFGADSRSIGLNSMALVFAPRHSG